MDNRKLTCGCWELNLVLHKNSKCWSLPSHLSAPSGHLFIDHLTNLDSTFKTIFSLFSKKVPPGTHL